MLLLSFLPFLTYLIGLSSPLIVYPFPILPYVFVLFVPHKLYIDFETHSYTIAYIILITIAIFVYFLLQLRYFAFHCCYCFSSFSTRFNASCKALHKIGAVIV